MDNLFDLLDEICEDNSSFMENLDHHSQLEFCYRDQIYQMDKDEIDECEDYLDIEDGYFDMRFEQTCDGFTSHGYISVFSIQENKYEKLPNLNEHFSKTIKDN